MVSPNRPGYTTYETPTEREIDPRPGGKWRYVWRKGDGANMAMEGDFREIAPPERLVTSESWGPE